MYRIAIFTLLISSAACKSKKDTDTGNMNTETQETVETADTSGIKPQRPYQVKAVIGENQESLPVHIKSARIEGNLLYLEVIYTGGCGVHDFEFIGSPVVIKTLPPKRTVKLVHKAGADKCESEVRQTIEVDVRELAYEQKSGQETLLLLTGYKESIHYKYE